MTGDLEETSAMSHVSVESARSGSWSGSVVGGFGFVDYPAGIPPKQWVSVSVVVFACRAFHSRESLSFCVALEDSFGAGSLPVVVFTLEESIEREYCVGNRSISLDAAI